MTDAASARRPWLAGLGAGLCLVLASLVLLLWSSAVTEPRARLLVAAALALAIAFTLVALRQLGRLQHRQRALEEMTEQLRHARRDAEAASEAKSAFLSQMNHEISTPFHGLMSMLSMLRESGLAPRQIDYLRSATESADHLLAVLNDILDLSQLESGRMTSSTAPADPRVLLREVEAQVRPLAMAKRLALHVDAAPGVPERVRIDGTRVKQLLIKLLSHAIRVSEHGAVVLDLRSSAGDAPGRLNLSCVVTCSGAMAEVTAPPGRGAQPGAGTGLDLEIARKLSQLMGGLLDLQGRPDAGSRCTLDLPTDAVASAGATTAASLAAEAPPGTPLQVLVAEDHPVNRQYMAALLESLGHVAYFTTNGQEAVQAARERRFDLVLMDLHMPVLDGLAATRAIRALPEAAPSTLPIVALTADAFEETRDRCLVAGMNDCLTKPVSPQKLSALLRRLFGAPSPPALHGAPAEDHSVPAAPAAQAGLALLESALIEMSLQAMPGARLAAMIDEFLDQGPETVQRLRAAVRDAQPLELRVNAHAARGAALNLGLAGLAATAEALHEGAAHLPAHEIARLVQRFEEQLGKTRQAIAASGLAQRPQTAASLAAATR